MEAGRKLCFDVGDWQTFSAAERGARRVEKRSRPAEILGFELADEIADSDLHGFLDRRELAAHDGRLKLLFLLWCQSFGHAARILLHPVVVTLACEPLRPIALATIPAHTRAMLIDHHCHLNFPQFAEDMAGVVGRAHAAGVGLMVTISTRIRQLDELIAIADVHETVFCSVGTHPHNADSELEIPTTEIVRLARSHPKIVAIGEAGLDYFYKKSSPEGQAEGFRRHIQAARETGLPLEIHTREADDDTRRILEEETAKGAFPAVLHCFTGGAALAQTAVDLGLYVSFTGVVTFKKSEELRRIATEVVPLDRILVETDAPYLAPEPYRGKTNEPAYVAYTAAALAAARGITREDFAAATTTNFFRLFTKVPQSAAAKTEKA